MSSPRRAWGIRTASTRDLAALEPIVWAPLLAAPKRRRFLRGLDEGEVVVVGDGDAIAAYAWIYEGFFGHTFLAYLATQPHDRRNGLAGMLLRATEQRAVTDRVFSSTNVSNVAMQAVFDRYGWRRCGQIDELDPGDPELVYVKFPAAAGAG
ncbi:MAG: GNAT family N-acetyltransferase [Candidatus Eremiobacteraeota bacterium]|nr:GNAT family N-acetyltransferase [Candidatus Eremiobacteraeota bacterium]